MHDKNRSKTVALQCKLKNIKVLHMVLTKFSSKLLVPICFLCNWSALFMVKTCRLEIPWTLIFWKKPLQIFKKLLEATIFPFPLLCYLIGNGFFKVIKLCIFWLLEACYWVFNSSIFRSFKGRQAISIYSSSCWKHLCQTWSEGECTYIYSLQRYHFFVFLCRLYLSTSLALYILNSLAHLKRSPFSFRWYSQFIQNYRNSWAEFLKCSWVKFLKCK